MSRIKGELFDAHRQDRIRLLQEDPARYFENAPRLTFRFAESDAEERAARRRRNQKS
ncbi:hypothetical protein [Corynebacterium lowii]|uniref:Uncharacterized protein n=1 Tax=Corynebacterium lowii TaxID=1544413 RepID=A0A0Q0UFU5_9CORY|nr:hypothetical protein [Corynebacterium lowii]KQB87004.1 hypothetical protein Clow_00049 [Corynebacterium lowii]MDP9852415.1 hypothetical protein [Corynebacterium lowii]